MLEWIFGLFSKGLGVKEIARRVGLSEAELKSVDLSYHEFSIKKRSGKFRHIEAPNPALKKIQRRLLRRLFAKLATHPSATGFQPGISFVDNARRHQSQQVIIRMDLVDFFSNTRSESVTNYFRTIGWNKRASKLLTQLTTCKGSLPQGAPTSPRLSNLVNYVLDFDIARTVARFDPNAIYTRYADDITISSSYAGLEVADLIAAVTLVIRYAGYRPHIGKKFDVRRQHQRQTVTGLVVNERANLSRETRRWLRAVEHRLRLKQAGGYLGPSPSLTPEQLEGWTSLRKMIDRETA
jgi:RNA-directed DNA polymerase